MRLLHNHWAKYSLHLKQIYLSKKIRLKDVETDIKYIAGLDASYFGDIGASCSVLFNLKYLRPIEVSYATARVKRYIPGYFSLREYGLLLKAFKGLFIKPDLIIVNACGINHPRKCGLASQIGISTNTPTIGITKSSLSGTVDWLHVIRRGELEIYAVKLKKAIVGFMITRGKEKIVVSPGHLITLETALKIALELIDQRLTPMPLALAHKLSKMRLEEELRKLGIHEQGKYDETNQNER